MISYQQQPNLQLCVTLFYYTFMKKMAESKGCHQCLWLLGDEDEITEVGAMNIFVLLKKQNSTELELVTPPLDSGVILPGITRRSVIELTKEWDEFEVNERKLTMGEVMSYSNHSQSYLFMYVPRF